MSGYDSDDELGGVEELCTQINAAANRGDTTFNFSHSHSVRAFPDMIRNLKRTLTVLHIDNNYQLGTLPAAIGELTQLTWLNVSYNRLKVLPAEIGRLRNLTRLHCNNNLLTALPLEVWNLKKLEELQADSNSIKAVPTGVIEMPALQTLYLDNNPLLTRSDVSNLESLEEKAPPPPYVGDCSLTRQRFTKCYIHVSFHDLCGNHDVPVVHYLASVDALRQMKIMLKEKYGVDS